MLNPRTDREARLLDTFLDLVRSCSEYHQILTEEYKRGSNYEGSENYLKEEVGDDFLKFFRVIEEMC